MISHAGSSDGVEGWLRAIYVPVSTPSPFHPPPPVHPQHVLTEGGGNMQAQGYNLEGWPHQNISNRLHCWKSHLEISLQNDH